MRNCNGRGSRWNLGSVLAAAALVSGLLGCDGDPIPGDPDASPVDDRPGAIQGEVRAAGAGPLGGVSIETSPQSGFAVTAADGAYLLQGVPAGTYQIRATKPGYLPVARSATVEAGGTVYVDFRLEAEVAPGAIAGHVVDSASGAPVAGASIATDPPTGTASSAEDGAYELAGLPPGAYAVHVTARGYLPLTSDPATVTQGATTTLELPLVAIVTYPSTCVECHTSEVKLLADLEADPPDEPPPAESEGEG